MLMTRFWGCWGLGFSLISGLGCSFRLNNPKIPEPGAVFGQPNFTSLSQFNGLNTPSHMIKVGNKLVVSDLGLGRVLIYNSVPSSLSQKPDIILGTPSTNPNLATLSAGVLRWPYGLASDGTRLVVVDNTSNRVLIWNTWPTQNQQPADVVVGQPDFTSSSSACTPSGLNRPSGALIDSGALYISDTNNHRVLVYSTVPTTSGASADFAIGQSDLTTCTTGLNAIKTPNPVGIHAQGGSLGVTNQSLHRIMFFSLPISGSGPTAFRVLGQSSFAANATTIPPTASSLYRPSMLTGDGTKWIVGDVLNNRVMIWNSLPSSNNQPADVVLGQADFTSYTINSTGVSNNTLNVDAMSSQSGGVGGFGVFSDGASLFVADSLNHRILKWDTTPTLLGVGASSVIGQNSFSGVFAGGGDGSKTIHFPTQLLVAQGKLLAASSFASNGPRWNLDNRILVWNSIPTASVYNQFSSLPSLAVGQADLKSNQGSPSYLSPTQSTLWGPMGMAWDGSRMYVADTSNQRILIYDQIPTSSGVAPTGVIGQTNFIGSTGGTSVSKLSSPTQISASQNILAIADLGNNRVLIFSPPPSATAMGPSANVVLGQPDFSTATANYGGAVSAQTLAVPRSVATDGKHVLVADTTNNRVLIWNSIPTQNQQAADLVLGQTNFSDNSINQGLGSSSPTASSLSGPFGVWTDGTRVAVADSNNNRILIWKTFPTQNGAPADAVLGQNDFTSKTLGGATLDLMGAGLTRTGLNAPRSALIYEDWVYISDTQNHRLLILPMP